MTYFNSFYQNLFIFINYTHFTRYHMLFLNKTKKNLKKNTV
jgi:hypothetical protein